MKVMKLRKSVKRAEARVKKLRERWWDAEERLQEERKRVEKQVAEAERGFRTKLEETALRLAEGAVEAARDEKGAGRDGESLLEAADRSVDAVLEVERAVRLCAKRKVLRHEFLLWLRETAEPMLAVTAKAVSGEGGVRGDKSTG